VTTVPKKNITSQLERLKERINLIESTREEALTLIEIVANANFFGQLKKDRCSHAKNGQCSYFMIQKKDKNMLPIISECKIEGCYSQLHYHLERSNITCCFCQKEKLSTINKQ
jgi:hypothetical protein